MFSNCAGVYSNFELMRPNLRHFPVRESDHETQMSLKVKLHECYYYLSVVEEVAKSPRSVLYGVITYTLTFLCGDLVELSINGRLPSLQSSFAILVAGRAIYDGKVCLVKRQEVPIFLRNFRCTR